MDDMVDAGLGVRDTSIDRAGCDDLQVVHDHNGGRPCLLHIGSGQGPYVFHGQRESTIDHTQPVPNGPRIGVDLRGHLVWIAGRQPPPYVDAGRCRVLADSVILRGVCVTGYCKATGQGL